MNNTCLHKYERLQKNSSFLEITYTEVNYVYFLGFKLNCFTPPQICQSSILRWKFNKARWYFF